MADNDDQVTFSPAEFKQLPLDYVISAPLMGTINAHKIAAQTSLDYVKTLASAPNQNFEQEVTSEQIGADGTVTPIKQTKNLSVPLLALSKVPNMNFDSLSIEFDYAINQVYKEDKSSQAGGSLKVSGSKFLSKFVDVGLQGSISGKKSTENTINKSGSLSIKLHASEAPLPEGLSKVMTWFTQGIEENTKPSSDS